MEASLPFWALMTFTVVMVLSPQSYFPGLERFRIALLTSIVAAIAFLYDRLIHGRGFGFRSREIRITAILAAWATVTIPFSYNPNDSFNFLINFYSKTLIIFWLLCNVVSSSRRLRQTFWLMSLMAIPLGASALNNFFSGVYLSSSLRVSQRITGYEAALTGNPNDLALMLNLILPMSIALLLSSRSRITRLLLLVATSLSAAGVIVTFSRAGFLTLTTLLLLYFWKLRHRPQKFWVSGVILFVLISIPLVGPAYLDRLSTITSIESDKTGSAQERWRDMTAAAQFTVAHPLLGAGIGQNVLATQEERGPDGGLVHDVYLQYAAELGLPGLLLFLFLYASSLKSTTFVQGRAKRQKDSDFFYLGEALQLSLIAFGVSAAFHPVAYHIYFYYISGLAVSAKAVCEIAETDHEK
jgi:probable O-glycosylation ligase (exosortase A-associated)